MFATGQEQLSGGENGVVRVFVGFLSDYTLRSPNNARVRSCRSCFKERKDRIIK